MKEIYVKPDLEVIELTNTDIITTSDCENDLPDY